MRTWTAAIVAAAGLHAQTVIGAKAGLISYALGDVSVDGRAIQAPATRWAAVKERSVLRTEHGLAEVLLGPCSVLRLGNESAFRLLAASPEHPRMELLSGSAVVEISAIARDADVTLQARTAVVRMARSGIYRFDAAPPLLKVFSGRAAVLRDGQILEIGAGRMLPLPGTLAQRFDRQPADLLDRWSGRRSVELAQMRGGGGDLRQKAEDTQGSATRAELPRYTTPRQPMGRGMDNSAPVYTGPHPAAAPSACAAGR